MITRPEYGSVIDKAEIAKRQLIFMFGQIPLHVGYKSHEPDICHSIKAITSTGVSAKSDRKFLWSTTDLKMSIVSNKTKLFG